MIPFVEILRVEESEKYGTFGILRINGEIFCVTLERADIENKPSVSSIPAQQYHCKKRQTTGHGETYEVQNVPDRTAILFHAGNTMDHSEGCILLGEKFGKLKGNRAVLNSGNTFKAFLEYMKDYPEFKLTIKEVY
jgi:hypothetical protein